jgi:hypothetical protein
VADELTPTPEDLARDLRADLPACAPTDDDLVRDLRADLELCGKATPGPWRCRHPLNRSRVPAPAPSLVYGPGISTPAHCYGDNFADGDFIAAARAGWPAAVRRAIAAEAEAARLRALAESLARRVAAQSELLSRRAEGGGGP